MQLNSYEFILILLPATLLCYYTLGRISVTMRKLILCASGAALSFLAGWKGFAVFVISLLVNYVLLEIMLEAKWLRKLCLVLTVLFDLLVMCVFRYGDFAITTVNDLLGKEIDPLGLTVPLGIAFFTLQQIAYAVKVCKGEIPELRFLDYLSFMLFLPKLVMGPLADPTDLIGQINDPERRRWSTQNFVSGIQLFSFGLFKKMIIADTFYSAVAWGWENSSSATSLDWVIIMLCISFMLYFDFSGYCDMAVGMASMMNITLPANFDSPYRALSQRDFWRRWHISLTKFFTEYVYIPLGGNKKSKLLVCIRIMIVFILAGAWYGLDFPGLLCAVLFGVLCVLDRLIEPVWKKLFKPLRWFFTFVFVNLCWLLYCSNSITDWLSALKTMVLGGSFSLSSSLLQCFRGVEAQFLESLLGLNSVSALTSGLGWTVLFLALGLFICLIPKNNYQLRKNTNPVFMVLAALAFVWSFLCLSSGSVFFYAYL